MNAIWHMMWKDLRLLVRDRWGLFWILVFPLVYAFFFGAIFSGDGNSGGGGIRIAVVDEDRSQESASFVSRLAGHASLRVAAAEGGAPRLRSLEDARALVRRGKRSAYVRLREGFAQAGTMLFGAGGSPAIEVGVDPSRHAARGTLRGVLAELEVRHAIEGLTDREKTKANLARMRERVLGDDAIPRAQRFLLTTFFGALETFLSQVDMGASSGAQSAFDPSGRVDFVDCQVARNGPPSAFAVTFPSAILWGLIGCAAAFAILIVRERSLGTMARLRTAPITLFQILAGKGAACFVAACATITLLLLVAKLSVGLALGDPLQLAAAIACSAFSFVGIMLVCSLLGRSEQAVAGATWGLMMPFAMLGGGMIPLMAMPPWLQSLSDVSPFKWSVLALEGAIWRGFSWSEMALPCAVLLGVGIAGTMLAVQIFKRSEAAR